MQPRRTKNEARSASILNQVRKGTVYTPPAIVTYICDEVLRAYRGAHPELDPFREPVKVLDIACGTGEFLTGMARALFDNARPHDDGLVKCIGEQDLKNDIATRSLFGIDIDANAISIARERLCQWCSVEHIASLDEHVIPSDCFDHDVDPFGTGKFDIIVGNPPYLFKRGLQFDGLGYEDYFKDTIAPNFHVSVQGRARQGGKFNTFGLFVARSLEWLRPGGILGCIVPNTLLRATTNETVRRMLVDHTRILQITDLGRDVFKNMTTSTIVLILQNSRPLQSNSGVEVRHKVTDLNQGMFETHHVFQSSFGRNPSCVFNIHVDPSLASLFDLMETDSMPLGSKTKAIIEGIVTRKGDGLLVTSPGGSSSKKLLRGRDINRYTLNWQEGNFIVYDEKRLHRPRPAWVHEAPIKLVCQRIGGRPYPLRVVVDTRQHYIFASTNAIILDESKIAFDIECYYFFLLGILNSMLVNAYYSLNYSNNSSLTVNVGKTFLEHIPIKHARNDVVECIGSLAKHLSLLYALNVPDEGFRHVVRFLDATIMDCLVYELYTTKPEDFMLIPVVQDVLARNSPFQGSNSFDFEFYNGLVSRLSDQSSSIPRLLTTILTSKWYMILSELIKN